MRLFWFTAALVVVSPLSGADWPQLLGPERNGVSAEKGLFATWPEKGPAVVWRRDVGEGFSGPVIADGVLVLFHRVADKEVVEGLDAATGRNRWTFSYPTAYSDQLGKGDGPRATPCIAGGRVYTLGAEGRLHCLSLKDGSKLWSRSLPDDYEMRSSFFGVGTSPLVEGGRVLVNVGARGAGIVAFDAATGKEAWKATDDDASYSSPVAATVGGVRTAFVLTRDGLVGVDPATGAVRFRRRFRARIDASVNAAVPLVVGEHLFLSASYNTGAALLRVRSDGLDEVWANDRSLSNHYNTSLHHDGYLYGIDGRQEQGPRLRCVELKTGAVRWTRDGFGCASMVLADGKVVALTEAGELVLFEATPAGYREKGRARALSDGPCRAEIALADGRLYGRDGKRLVCWQN